MSTSTTLLAVEENLVALLDSEPMVDDPEQRKAIEADIVRAHLATVAKRDAFGEFYESANAQISAMDELLKRVSARKKRFQAAIDRLENYAVFVMQSLGTKSLEGSTVTLALHKCPPSVEVSDEAIVDAKYKTLHITVSAAQWQALMDNIGMDAAIEFAAAVKKTEVDVSKSAIKADIQCGVEVAGAHLVTDKYGLKVK